MAKRKGLSEASKERLKWIRQNKRNHAGSLCQYCGPEWRIPKWNFYNETSGACQQCLSHLNQLFKRGSAWFSQRRKKLATWNNRYDAVAPVSRRHGLKSVAGGRR